MKNVEPYLVPLAVLVTAYVGRWLADHLCFGPAAVCTNASELFAHVYWACFVLMLIVGGSNVRAFYDHAKALAPVLLGASPAKAS